MPLLMVPLSGAAGEEVDDAAMDAAAQQLGCAVGALARVEVERGAGCTRPRTAVEAPAAESYLDVRAERDALRVKCEKLGEAFSLKNDSKGLMFVTNRNRLLEAEVEDLRAQLQDSEAFKADVMQRVKELQGQIACLTDELLRVQLKQGASQEGVHLP